MMITSQGIKELSALYPIVVGFDAAPNKVIRRTATRVMDNNQQSSSKKFKLNYQTADPDLYHRQYFHVYETRLKAFRPLLVQVAKEKSSNLDYIFPEHISNLQPDTSSIIIGTIYRHSESKPSILKEYANDQAGMMPRLAIRDAQHSFASIHDVLYLEDEKSRIRIEFDDKALQHNQNGREDGHRGGGESTDTRHMLATGVVVALKGIHTKKKDSIFLVQDIIYPSSVHRIIRDISLDRQISKSESRAPHYICFVSGLHIGDVEADHMESQLVAEYLKGNLVNDGLCENVRRLVIVGDSICRADRQEGGPAYLDQFNKLTPIEKKRAADPLKRLDAFLASVSSSVPVDIMPGEQDPTNYLLPQQPLNPCLFPGAQLTGNLYPQSNPFQTEIALDLARDETHSQTHPEPVSTEVPSPPPPKDKVAAVVQRRIKVLGTSGQNLDDWARSVCWPEDQDQDQNMGNSEQGDTKDTDNARQHEHKVEKRVQKVLKRLDLMEMMLRCKHMAPTAPDTLAVQPFTDKDPFQIEEVPDLFFVGNQPAFGTRLVGIKDHDSKLEVKCRLICIPKFIETKQVVIMNAETFECDIVSF